jgi:hypothetical protein
MQTLRPTNVSDRKCSSPAYPENSTANPSRAAGRRRRHRPAARPYHRRADQRIHLRHGAPRKAPQAIQEIVGTPRVRCEARVAQLPRSAYHTVPKRVLPCVRPQVETLRIDRDAVTFLRSRRKGRGPRAHADQAGERQTEKKLSLP